AALVLAAATARWAEPARTRVRAPDQQEVGREGERHRQSRDPHDALLERLSKCVERARRELAQLVEEEHAMMRQRDLAGMRPTAPAAHDRRDGRGVMG